ncbi:acyltransferase [Niallia circulans]|uniref:Acyltransferase n=1 Tax=Niallia circulans TaxID=1397 RepID=A0A553SIK0_NIACI|nr:acyltransferase [Niallia circulans]TRZ36815.1 acyltransferase [Niallia circulans]
MERNYTIDLIKFFAIFLVVCIHTNPFNNTVIFGVRGDYVSNIIVAVAKIGVPLFFAISGYLFYTKFEITEFKHEYFKKYMRKIFNLFVCWYIFYVIYDLFVILFTNYSKGFQIVMQQFQEYFSSLFNLGFIFYGTLSNSSYHLWYLIALLWAVLILYIALKMKKLNTLLIISLVLHFIGQFGQSYSGLVHIPLNTRDAFFFGLFYVSLGSFFAKNKTTILKTTKIIKITPLISMTIFFTFFQVIERLLTYSLWNPTNINYFITTIPAIICLLLIMVKYTSIARGSFVSKIGANAVGIYVTHVFFLELITTIIDTSTLRNVLAQFILTPFIFFLSYIFYNNLQLIKKKMKKRTNRFQKQININ